MSLTSSPAQPVSKDEVELLDLWRTIWRQKVVVLAVGVIPVLVAAALTLVQPRSFVAETILYPTPRNNDSTETLASSVAAQAGPVAALLGGFAAGKTPDLLEVLSSRTIVDRVIARTQLDQKLGGSLTSDEIKERLAEMVAIVTPPKSRAIAIRVKAQDPELAALIANTYVDELKQILDEMTRATAARNLELVESQLAKVRQTLETSEAKVAALAGKGNAASALVQKQEAEVTRATYLTLLQYREAASIAKSKDLNSFILMDKAEAPSSPAPSRSALYLAIGLLAGVVLGILAAFTRERVESAKRR